MIDQNSQFFAILTAVGEAKQASANALGVPWTFAQMGVGDANNTEPVPSRTQTSLINERRRAPLNQLTVDPKDASIIIAEQVIPPDVGGWWIREIGLYDAVGDLVAVANCAPSFKPLLTQGTGKTQVVRLSIIVTSTVNVQLKIDPAVVLATREYVSDELARQDFKHSALVATTAAITLSGLQTVDGVALTAGARVLVKNQAAAKDNGLYLASAGGWTRCGDADTNARVTPGLLVLIERGTVNSDSAWQLVTDGAITIGVTSLTFEMAFGRTGVVEGTYRSVQVDKYGRVVAATNPTTVAGYGITDVYTKAQSDAVSVLKAPLASPLLTGTPAAPTAVAGTETTQIATTAFVAAAIRALIASAPGALDTLNELAAAIGNDPNFATTVLNALAGKADKATTLTGYSIADAYTKTQIDAALALKAPVASPVLTGAPAAPTAAAGSNTTQLANTAFVQAALALVVDSAPGALNTLKKLATALGNDPAFASSMATALAGKATKGTSLAEYGILDGATQTELSQKIGSTAATDIAREVGFRARSSQLPGAVGVNFNDVTTPGCHEYLLYGTHTNGPGVAAYFYVEVFEYAARTLTQVLTPYAGGTTIYWRSRYQDNWTSWESAVTSSSLIGLLPAATASRAGIAMLNHSITSGDQTMAASAYAVKLARDLAVSKATPATASLLVNGWSKDNDTGEIEQWGTVTALADNSLTSVTFPIAFPVECLNGSVAFSSDPGTSGSDSLAFLTPTKTGFTLRVSGNNTTNSVYWRAKGR